MTDMSVYGEAKVACERLVARRPRPGPVAARAGRADRRSGRRVRPHGLLARRGSPTPAAADGSVLVPDEPDLPGLGHRRPRPRRVAARRGRTAASPARTTSSARGSAWPSTSRSRGGVAGHTGPLRGASSAWLLEHGVEPWMGPRSLPLWLARPRLARVQRPRRRPGAGRRAGDAPARRRRWPTRSRGSGRGRPTASAGRADRRRGTGAARRAGRRRPPEPRADSPRCHLGGHATFTRRGLVPGS